MGREIENIADFFSALRLINLNDGAGSIGAHKSIVWAAHKPTIGPADGFF
jgi:hypothetical protein